MHVLGTLLPSFAGMVLAKRKSAEPFAGNFGPLGDATGGLNFAAHGRSPRPSRGRLLEDQEHLAILEQESITAVMKSSPGGCKMCEVIYSQAVYHFEDMPPGISRLMFSS